MTDKPFIATSIKEALEEMTYSHTLKGRVFYGRDNRKVYKGIIPYYITMDRLTIYPDEKLQKQLNKEAEKQKRSLNNLVLFILSSYFEKNNGKK